MQMRCFALPPCGRADLCHQAHMRALRLFTPPPPCGRLGCPRRQHMVCILLVFFRLHCSVLLGFRVRGGACHTMCLWDQRLSPQWPEPLPYKEPRSLLGGSRAQSCSFCCAQLLRMLPPPGYLPFFLCSCACLCVVSPCDHSAHSARYCAGIIALIC